VVTTDINGCNSTPFSITIAEPIALTVSVIGTNPDCSGLCNGNADAAIIGGTTPYSILWDDPSSQTTSLASNLCAGTFNIDVTDANGCVQAGNAILTAPIGITSNSTFTDETCFELCDGSAAVNPSGGTLPYTVLWSDGSSTNTISNLCAGTYDVDITDANGCNTFETITIDPSIEITSTFTFANSTCGSCIGSALVTPAGGVPGYTYQWDAAAGGGTSQNISNLCAGVFSVDITDAAGCTETVGVSISDNNAELVTIIPTDASCFDVCDGSAIATTACLDGPCTFEWFDGAGVTTGVLIDNITNLCADNYFVEVTNASGCITVENTTINEPLEIEGNGIVTDANCGGVCDGSVVLTPSGGNGVFTFLWTDPSAQTTQTATNLCGGNVDVQITSGGCTITETYFINQPIAMSASVVSTDAQCNGDCNATATLTVNDGVLPYSFTWDDGATQSTQAAINLCAGNYNVSITDANGCNLILPVFVNEPIALTASVSSNDVNCFGNCNGDATVIPAGGNAPYTIQWDDPALQTSLTATSLCAGNYNVMVTDANFCTTVPTPVTINENPDIVISASSTDVTCNSFCDGTITINAAGGDGNYQFSIDNGANFQAGNLFTNLCGGSYDVVVIDGNNCQSSLNVNMNEPSALSGTVDNFDATCNVSNGSANAIPTNGTPGYTFEWLDAALVPIGQSTQGATGLSAGLYNVEITDASGCITILTATVSNFNGPTATLFATTQPVCNGDCNGAINMEITGGTGGYTYSWFAGGQTTEDLSNVCAGNYTLQVTDAVGCLSFANATLNENDVIDATFVVTDATCGACDGASTITPTGGDGFYSILWTNGDSGLSSTNLCAGAYGAQVTDGLGCEQTINFAVSNPTGPTSETIISTDASCFGVCDGTADVTPIGGTAPYTFFWLHDASTSNTVSNLCPGTYFCEITDANDCIRVSEIQINDAAQIIDSTNITPADCGVCNGGLQIFASGGNGPFSFQWNAAAGGVTTQNVSNLCEGIYSVTVTDGNGCTDSFTYSVNGKNAPQISTTTIDANCNGSCDGTANVFTIGGTGPFVETWMDDSGTNLGLAGPSVNTLCEGDYLVQILDQATGCLTTTNFTIDQPDSLQFSLPFLQDNSCFASCDGQLEAIVINGTLPFTYQWDNPASSTSSDINSLCAGTYNVIVTDANGCTDSQSGTINEPTEVTMAFVITDASCSTVADGAIDVTAAGGAGGYTYSWTGPNNFTSISEDLTNIFTGMYYLTTTDANGCSFTDSAFVNALIIVNADAGNDTTICGNLNTFTVNGNGGVTYEWFDLAGNSLSTSPSYTFNPTPGTTTLVLIAADGLCIGRDTIIIGIFTPPNADAGEDVFTAFGIPISFGGNPTGTAGTSLNWSPGVDLNDSTATNPTATIDTTTTFIVTVSDANGCVDTDTVVVEVLSPIFIPNGFSPNGDGPNDVWEIDFIEYFPECQVEVYNRWGQLLFISVGYQIPWDGKYEDKEVPIGTYYYVINLNNPLFPDAYTGPLTILR
jgi:gliding motility-associated-like protein